MTDSKSSFGYSLETDNSSPRTQSEPLYDLPQLDNISRGVMLKLIGASIVGVIFLATEITGGLISGSLAILSDAAHMFSDLSGFLISIFSVWLATKPSSNSLSYGYHRAEVIGALGSIFLIWALTILLLYEATHRIIKKEPV